jgi:MFS transporter, DHA2 family, multidrug resistance protein
VDARRLIVLGLLVMGAGCYWTANLNLAISPGQVVWPRVVVIVGLSMLFAPINVAAYMYTPTALRGAAVGLFSLLRNEGGSVGTSLAQTIHERRDQFHTLRLNETLDPLNPNLNSYFEQAQAFFYRQTGDAAQSYDMALEGLAALREQQSSSLAYFDVFWLCSILAVVLVMLVFFMKRSAAEKGAHLAAE